jgi:hypothetical protein
MRRVPGGAGLPGLLLGRLEVGNERVVRIPFGRQILLLRLQPGVRVRCCSYPRPSAST